jgi:glutamate racemase
MKIGFFDSGLGGLTILKAVARELPQYDYVFYGDTAHLPYGDKSEADIYKLTQKGIEHLFTKECLLVIVACNTASAETLRRLQSEWIADNYPDRKILGVIVPTVEKIIESASSNVILLATKRTVESDKYQLELNKYASQHIELEQLALPELVPLIEIGDIDTATELVITKIQTIATCPKQIVLGCTHYTEIKEQLREHFLDTQVISQDELIPESLKLYLSRHPEIQHNLSTTATRTIDLTEHKPTYDRIIQQFLGGHSTG